MTNQNSDDDIIQVIEGTKILYDQLVSQDGYQSAGNVNDISMTKVFVYSIIFNIPVMVIIGGFVSTIFRVFDGSIYLSVFLASYILRIIATAANYVFTVGFFKINVNNKLFLKFNVILWFLDYLAAVLLAFLFCISTYINKGLGGSIVGQSDTLRNLTCLIGIGIWIFVITRPMKNVYNVRRLKALLLSITYVALSIGCWYSLYYIYFKLMTY